MKKKVVLGVVLAAVLTTGTTFAEFGIGVQGGGGALGGGGGLNLAFSGVFLYIDGFSAWDGGLHLSGALDFIDLYGTSLVNTLDFYIRFGIGAGLWGFNDELRLAASARLPIGLSWRPISLLEIFLQLVPEVGARILPPAYLFWNVGANLGLRLWF